MKASNIDRNTKDLFIIVRWGTAVAFGALFATLQALRIDSHALSLHFSAMTALTFVLGTGATLYLWRFLLRGSSSSSKKMMVAVRVLIAVGVVTFIYPLRFLPREKMLDISKGLAFAVLVLSGVGYMMYRVAKALNADARENENRGGAEKRCE
ncbi:MAG: hypothetical protein JWN25_3285 [Verrucomicrobiales bacterium]|nr:hypothetical protein [Verrucomicrobiales bacterium]